jgi:CBS-domain-containing membrane protein
MPAGDLTRENARRHFPRCAQVSRDPAETAARRSPDASLLDAAHLHLETNQRGLPVIDSEGTLVGIISEDDFLHRVELDVSPPPGNWLEEILGIEEDTPARQRMRAGLVREAMSPDPVFVDGG